LLAQAGLFHEAFAEQGVLGREESGFALEQQGIAVGRGPLGHGGPRGDGSQADQEHADKQETSLCALGHDLSLRAGRICRLGPGPCPKCANIKIY